MNRRRLIQGILREGLNIPKRSSTDIGDLLYNALALLNYSFEDINWDYNLLTANEKVLITEDEFNQLRDIYFSKIGL